MAYFPNAHAAGNGYGYGYYAGHRGMHTTLGHSAEQHSELAAAHDKIHANRQSHEDYFQTQHAAHASTGQRMEETRKQECEHAAESHRAAHASWASAPHHGFGYHGYGYGNAYAAHGHAGRYY